MKNLKRVMTMLTMVLCLTAMTACGGNESKNGKETETTTLPIEAEYTDLGGVENPSGETTTTTVTSEEPTTEDSTEASTDTSENGSDEGSNEGGNGGSGETYEPNKPNPKGDVDGDDVYMNSVKLVPDGELTHSGVNFGLISVNGKPEIDIFKLNRTELLEETPWTLSRRAMKNMSYAKFDFPDFSFYGNIYGDGVHLEYLEDDMVLLVDQSEKDRLWDAELKGLEWSILEADHERKGYDHITFYNDVVIGMFREEAEAAMGGEGTVGTEFIVEYTDGAITYYPVIYKSESTTMVIMYEDWETLTDEVFQRVSRVFVLKNN